MSHAAPALTASAAHETVTTLDPRARIGMAGGFALTAVALDSLAALTLALMAALALMALSGLPPRRTLRRMAMMDGFILFMLVLLPFTTPGAPMATLWGLTATWDGLRLASQIALTANAVILTLMVLVGTMDPVTLGHALHSLRVPARLVHLLLFTVRYVDVLRDEYLRLRAAMKVRGFRPTTSWHCYRSLGYLVGMMLVRATERSERILGAMKCRGFAGQFPLLAHFALTRRDHSALVACAALCGALITLDILWR